MTNATLIQFPLDRIRPAEVEPDAADAITWQEVIAEIHDNLEDAYGAIRSPRAARAIMEADVLVDALAEAINDAIA